MRSLSNDHEPEMAPLNAQKRSLPKIVPREMELFVSVIIYIVAFRLRSIVGKQQWLVELGGGRQGCQDTPSAVTQFDSTPHALMAFLQCPPRSHRQRPAQPRPFHSPATANLQRYSKHVTGAFSSDLPWKYKCKDPFFGSVDCRTRLF